MQHDFSLARRSIGILFALFGAVALFAQEAPFVIKSVEFSVEGRSRAFVLRQKIEAEGPVIGRSFDDLDSLDAYIEDRRQALSNNRVLASVEASRSIEPGPAGGSDVRISFAVVDTWNIAVLPKPEYDSNKGLTLYLKAKDYNFAGSMQPLSLNLSYVSDTADNKSFEADTSFSLPFAALGAEWSLGVAEDFQAWTNGIIASSSSVSLTYNIPGFGFPASVQAQQGLFYNYDQPIVEELDPWYMGEYLAFNASIPLGISLGELGGVFYAPSISASQNWWPNTALQVYGRPGLSLGMTNALSSGRIDWIGNMRQGVTGQIASVNTYYAYYSDLIWDISASFAGYSNHDRKIGLSWQLSSRIRAMGHFPADDFIDLGSGLRGIVDSRAVGVAGLYANLSLPIKLFDFPSHILIKKNWLDFELQAQPFVDAGVVLPGWDAKPNANWLWTSGGIEILVYPVVMRSFIVRASVGWDLMSVIATRSLKAASPRDDRSPYEIFIGTGLSY
jgi:hypothetical protein